MKSLFSEQYYKDHWDEFLKKVPGDHYINLEAELKKELDVFNGVLTEEQIKKVEPIYARQIADKCHRLVMKELQTLKEVMSGNASWGYVVKRQNIEAGREFRVRFDFNCLQLREFKKAHNID